jgi:hypothetical protein
MQSKTDFGVKIESGNTRKEFLNSLELYEEYKQKNVTMTINMRQEDFSRISYSDKRKLEEQVDQELHGFCVWLVEKKDLDDETARYCSISVKSLILGIPAGEQIAQLFDLTMNNRQ